jgi:two-component system cell cycle response regulator DivK
MTRILLVEDNEMNRDVLSRQLTRNGYEVVIAVDGQQGFDMALSERPDLILMDMSLPMIDGWEATHRIKAEGTTAQIPVIALTAHAWRATGKKRSKWVATTTTPSRSRSPACSERWPPC